MLAMADHAGRVWASIPGLANRARVSVEAAEAAIKSFLSPDPYSRTKDFEGRRVEEIDGGWRLLNHAKYRAIRDQESIKESKRTYINNKRAEQRRIKSLQSNGVDRGRHIAEADTEADTDNFKSEAIASSPNGLSAADVVISIPLNDKTEYAISKTMLAELEALYPAVDVPQTLREIRGWNLTNPEKRKTRRGVMGHVNRWLAKEQNRG